VDSSALPLIERIRRGDTAALAEYVEGRRLQLLAYITRHLGAALKSRIEADDIFQETNLEAIRRIAELGPVERDPFGWLCQIAEQRLIDAHRRLFGAQKRSASREVGLSSPGDDTQHSPLINLLVASMTTPSAAFSRDQKEMQLAHALEALPEEGREALRLRYVEGLPTKEIAARLGKTDGAIRVLLTRSLSRLQGFVDA
jgi:RNA polymerase sigma-70 factor (ECF subfamily)